MRITGSGWGVGIDLTPDERDILRERPEEITPQLLGSLRARTSRMNAGDRRLVEQALHPASPAQVKTDEAEERGRQRARDKKSAPFTFTQPGGDVA